MKMDFGFTNKKQEDVKLFLGNKGAHHMVNLFQHSVTFEYFCLCSMSMDHYRANVYGEHMTGHDHGDDSKSWQ